MIPFCCVLLLKGYRALEHIVELSNIFRPYIVLEFAKSAWVKLELLFVLLQKTDRREELYLQVVGEGGLSPTQPQQVDRTDLAGTSSS